MFSVKRRTVPINSISSILSRNVLKDTPSSKIFFYYTITNHKPPFKSFLHQK